MIAAPEYVTRRATVEDLPQLVSLWQLERLPAALLEKRFTEFQVVSDDAGQVLAAIGIQLSGTNGLLHSESIAQPEIGDQLRALLWKRLQVTVHNHALERLWTQLNFPFWREQEFTPASPEQLASMPPQFKGDGGQWHVKILPAAKANAAFEQEFAQIKIAQQREREKLASTVTWMKRAAIAALFFLMLAGGVAVIVLRYAPHLFKR
ncbi:MAG TPA: hypothetical protein VNT99_16105 [Methylomirabilota bacterium]|nr:hypothetical protein [Methylomirabilota bacterium]